ncbi:MAG: PQQ-binding-like beta-propeller repeat protein [Planctomycetes bacterium]|nr:PQQ-binding-like beta-propeller repeat protein [Planctomycetota bacterium]
MQRRLACGVACVILAGAGRGAAEWPRFRGPGGAGRAAFGPVSTTWDLATGSGVLWKIPVPIPGESSPILWGGRVVITGATKARREVVCLDLETGSIRWRREVRARRGSEPGEDRDLDEEGFIAAPTPATDGERIHAIFGTGELACLDLDGRVLWTRDLGIPDNDYGHASSLEIWRDFVIVQRDQGRAKDGKSRLLGIDARTGRTVWEAKRLVPASWSTPLAFCAAGRDQIVACGDPWVIAYDPANGAELWRASVLGGEVVPSPIVAGGVVIAASVGGAVAAIRPDGSGDVTATHVVWRHEENLPGIPTPVSDGDLVFTIDTSGYVTCLDAKDGGTLWEDELRTSFQASPVIAGGLVYFLSDRGDVFIFACARARERAARASIGEKCLATPALAPGRMIVRGERHLFCLGSPTK